MRAKIPTPEKKAVKKLFNNELLNVYPQTLPLDRIHYWPENNRTIFTFERLRRQHGNKKLNQIPIEDITAYVARQPIHKLQELADSIKRNGVQVPLIISNTGKLLDGNRRYFACQWIKMKNKGKPLPETITKIPVYVIREIDLTGELELKILAEANFIDDLRVPWSLDAQARAVESYYNGLLKRKDKNADPMAVTAEVFGIKRARVEQLLGALALTKKFIEEADEDEDEITRHAIVEERFVYFWEFMNKAMKGRRVLEEGELSDVQAMFFNLMARGPESPIKNVKQVEPLVQSRRDKIAWNMMTQSKGAKLGVVVAMMLEKKELLRAEDKINAFMSWLREADGLTDKAKSRLRLLAKLAHQKSS